MLSILIIVKNQEEIIKACIKSVDWADEIVVIDTGSNDRTIEKAESLGAKVYKYSGKEANFSSWRNYGLTKVNGDFLFVLDADERVLVGLRKELEDIISVNENSDVGAWKVSRVNVVLGQVVKYPAFWPDYVIRLFKTSNLIGWEGLVHEQPVFKGNLKTLKHSLLHLTHRDIDSMVMKSLDWANIDASLRLEVNHPKMHSWRFLRILFTELWNQGVMRKGFFNGNVGTIDAILQAFSLWLSYVKLWQLQRKETLSQTYQKIDKELIDSGFRFD